MACNNPSTLFYSGGRRYVVPSRQNDQLIGSPLWSKFDKLGLTKEKPILIPCGKCLACKATYARDWANRCFLESLLYEHNSFLTLTYDESSIPKRNYVDNGSGLYLSKVSLDKRDVQLFLKRLRIFYSRYLNVKKIRFFMCGEYGPRTQRPHYHLLLFNLPVYDKVLYSKNEYGSPTFTSKILSKLWGKGNCIIGNVSYESASYVARYTAKKIYKADKTSKLGLVSEYVSMSRKPGIGEGWFKSNYIKLYRQGSIPIATSMGKFNITPNRYFDKLYSRIISEEDFISLKRKRQFKASRLIETRLGVANIPDNLFYEKNEILAISKKKLVKKRGN